MSHAAGADARPGPSDPPRRGPWRWLGPLLVLAAGAWLWMTGVAGVGRTGSRWLADFDWIYCGGRVWIEGASPYDFTRFSEAMQRLGAAAPTIPFPYPPPFAPWGMGLALFDHPTARWVMVGLDLLSLLTLGWLTACLVTTAAPSPARNMAATRWLLPAIVIGSPFAAHLLWLGQMTPVTVALLVGGWLAVRRNHEVWGGLLLGIAPFKPQFVLLPMVWLLLEGRIRALGVAAGVLSAGAAVGMGLGAPLKVMWSWLAALPSYADEPSNRLGSEFVTGVPSLLAAAGVPVPSVGALTLLGVSLVGVLWWCRKRVAPDDVLAWLVSIQCLVVWAHSNDLILLAPLAASLWRRLAHRQELWLPAAAGLLALYLPQRLVRLGGLPILHHWRTLVVTAAVWALARLPRGETATITDRTDSRPAGRTGSRPAR